MHFSYLYLLLLHLTVQHYYFYFFGVAFFLGIPLWKNAIHIYILYYRGHHPCCQSIIVVGQRDPEVAPLGHDLVGCPVMGGADGAVARDWSKALSMSSRRCCSCSCLSFSLCLLSLSCSSLSRLSCLSCLSCLSLCLLSLSCSLCSRSILSCCSLADCSKDKAVKRLLALTSLSSKGSSNPACCSEGGVGQHQ